MRACASAPVCVCISGSGCLGSCETSGWSPGNENSPNSLQVSVLPGVLGVVCRSKSKSLNKELKIKLRLFEYSLSIGFRTLEDI